MAKWIIWTPEQQQMWDEWLAERPEVIRKMVEDHKLHPDALYLYKADVDSESVRCTLVSLEEGGTVTIAITSEFNPDHPVAQMLGSIWDRQVFNIPPEKLSECELPKDMEAYKGDACIEE